MLIIPIHTLAHTHTHSLSHTLSHPFSCLAALFRLFISHCFRYVSISIGFISILSLSLDSFRFALLCLASLWFRFCFVWCFLLCRVFYQASNQAHHHSQLLRPEQCGRSLPSPLSPSPCCRQLRKRENWSGNAKRDRRNQERRRRWRIIAQGCMRLLSRPGSCAQGLNK